MSTRRPDERGFNRLPMLAASKSALETCTFCPKLCRSACPVSNAEPRESLTPWGKMSSAYHLGRGDVASLASPGPSSAETAKVEAGFAKVAFACTGCLACANACDHGNPVAETLNRARTAVTKAGLAPASATNVLAGFARNVEEATARARTIDPESHGHSPRVALVVGCGYLRSAESEARAALAATRALAGRDVRLIGGCCGLPLLHAGDEERFESHLRRFAASLEGYDEIFAVDAGCARTLRVEAKTRGLGSGKVELVIERAAKELHALTPLPEGELPSEVRYHDPCQLSRGLGVVEAPRAVLTRLLGRPPAEFVRNRAAGACSGAGGLLPVTHPGIAKDATVARLHEHERAGGGAIVTACASSLRAFRKNAPPGSVHDVVALLARGLARG